eukprot:GHRR01012524.1.p1 GENE.GHRR01012524.1~~GHRR01012524.1.p1  ORF type:complete len:136 (-),score=0.49 GHRR01012524.1:283-690(-)
MVRSCASELVVRSVTSVEWNQPCSSMPPKQMSRQANAKLVVYDKAPATPAAVLALSVRKSEWTYVRQCSVAVSNNGPIITPAATEVREWPKHRRLEVPGGTCDLRALCPVGFGVHGLHRLWLPVLALPDTHSVQG